MLTYCFSRGDNASWLEIGWLPFFINIRSKLLPWSLACRMNHTVRVVTFGVVISSLTLCSLLWRGLALMRGSLSWGQVPQGMWNFTLVKFLLSANVTSVSWWNLGSARVVKGWPWVQQQPLPNAAASHWKCQCWDSLFSFLEVWAVS